MVRNSRLVLAVALAAVFISCSSQPDAQSIIDKAIEAHGGDRYNHSYISFTFRDRDYTVRRDGGVYQYTRKFQDSTAVILDKMDNNGFTRIVNGEPVSLPEEDKQRYSNSINSVIYFALLPYALNDEAVIKEYLGPEEIKGEPYYEIFVSFRQDGGGKDHEDTFVYWIHQNDYTMDYLAYKFHVDGGGIRFRDATKTRVINGIRFADYDNYKQVEEEVPLQQYDSLYINNRLEKISEINLENIEVMSLGEKGEISAN